MLSSGILSGVSASGATGVSTSDLFWLSPWGKTGSSSVLSFNSAGWSILLALSWVSWGLIISFFLSSTSLFDWIAGSITSLLFSGFWTSGVLSSGTTVWTSGATGTFSSGALTSGALFSWSLVIFSPFGWFWLLSLEFSLLTEL